MWLRLTDQYGAPSLVNMALVIRIQPVDEGSRLTTTGVETDGPMRMTVRETPEEIAALLKAGQAASRSWRKAPQARSRTSRKKQ